MAAATAVDAAALVVAVAVPLAAADVVGLLRDSTKFA